MNVYQKILVTMDCSPVDDAIIAHVSLLARQNSAEVFLLHVVHAHTMDQKRALGEKAEKHLEVHRAALEKEGVTAHVVFRIGEPEDEILKEIEEKDYDLVAMATHGHHLLGDILFGSVSDKLKHSIRVPLLLIRSPSTR
ncbi:MAG: universal stress protein [Deltaproteobacteria bacterium]|nr:universal stress protein [Deltaproteobacteria bacterium]